MHRLWMEAAIPAPVVNNPSCCISCPVRLCIFVCEQSRLPTAAIANSLQYGPTNELRVSCHLICLLRAQRRVLLTWKMDTRSSATIGATRMMSTCHMDTEDISKSSPLVRRFQRISKLCTSFPSCSLRFLYNQQNASQFVRNRPKVRPLHYPCVL